MKKQSTKKLLVLFLAFGIISTSLTIFASTKSKYIRASLDENFKYTLNNQSVLNNQPTIIYNGKAYLPVDTLSNTLGYHVNIKNNHVTISTPASTTPIPPAETSPWVTIPKADILAIDFAANTLTVLPVGKPNLPENQIILKVTNQTTITDGQTKKLYSIKDLNTRLPIKVIHSAAMTKSIPPQTQALSITLLGK